MQEITGLLEGKVEHRATTFCLSSIIYYFPTNML